ncbi:MAG: hypothetical protein WBA97_34290 [Actinophytocola sp.]|uniref:hypothetical protein n=1 Tax=Actinophytocola sp. TaxID=1872138 RepID=UPI003C7808DA
MTVLTVTRTDQDDTAAAEQPRPARCFLATLTHSFDWPCSCGKPGSQCTQKEDGSCE